MISVLTEAQTAAAPRGSRRKAGPCPLRGMRTATVASGEGARLAAAVSLVLASAKLRDHVADGDGLLARRPVAAAARRVAASWDRGGTQAGAGLGFDTAVLLDAVARQPEIEAAATPGSPLLAVTEPTETATAAAVAHTAHLAGRPGNAAPLAEVGRFFGRLAHLLDAVEDQAADDASGAWNPLTATGTDRARARQLCDDAVRGVRLALREVEFEDDALVRVLLEDELRRSLDRAFRAADGHQRQSGQPHRQSPWITGNPMGPSPYPPQPPRRRRGTLAGCAVWTGLCCTGQICCRETYPDPWVEREREGWCRDECDCDCCGDCCNCNCCGGDSDGDGGGDCCSCDCCDC